MDGISTTRQRTQQAIDPLTGLLTNQTVTVVQVGTGLNFQDASGAWQQSLADMALTTNGGAAAAEGPLKVQLSPAGLNDDNALTVSTPSGLVLSARVLGVYLYDSQSGQSRLLAAPSSSAVAEQLSPNQVIYRSAFNSDTLQADLRYTYTPAGFESDVILTRQPKLSPQDCGFNPDTTLLQVHHQWRNAPTPADLRQITVGQGTAALPDQFITLGDVFFPPGRASLTDGSSANTNAPAQLSGASPQNAGTSVPVGKEWQSATGPGYSDLLIESVSWSSIATNLASLPLMAQAGGPPSECYYASAAGEGFIWPATPGDAPGLVLDYIVLYGGYANYEFQACAFPSYTEYYIDGNSGSPYFSGTVTFDANCVVGFTNSAGLTLYGSVVCNGTQASPSVLTSTGDLQYGQLGVITTCGFGGCAYRGTAGTALYFDYATPANINLSGLVIRNATTAIECVASCSCDGSQCYTTTVSGCSLCNCGSGVYSTGMNIAIQNSYAYQVDWPVNWGGGCWWNQSGSFGTGTPPTSTTLSPLTAVMRHGGSVWFTATLAPAGLAAPTYRWWAKGGAFGSVWEQIASGNQVLMLGNPLAGTQIQISGGDPFGEVASVTTATVLVLADPAGAEWNTLTGVNGLTNGATSYLWSKNNANNPQTGNTAWEGNSLIRAYSEYTAISQDCIWDGGSVGNDSFTALTARHAYGAGHQHIGYGLGTNYFYTAPPYPWVAFCDANNNVTQVNVLGYFAHYNDYTDQDYTVLIFDRDLTGIGVTPMPVAYQLPAAYLVLTTGQAFGGTVQYGATDWYGPLPEGCLPTLVSDFYTIGGDSGSPLMVPTTTQHLVFFGGKTTTGPSQQMQADMDALTVGLNVGLNPANYQMTTNSGNW